MTRYYRRRSRDWRRTGTAAAVAAGVAVSVGAVVFYVTRIFLAREPLGGTPESDEASQGPAGASSDS